MSEAAIARYALRHCRPTLAVRENGEQRHWPDELVNARRAAGLWQLAALRHVPKIVDFRVNPVKAETNVVKHAHPVCIFFEQCPSVDVRQYASQWSNIVRPQSSWTNYVFGEDPLFPKERPIVLFSPPPDGEDGAYLQHASLLAPKPQLVCLRDTDLVFAAASLAGAKTLPIDDVTPEEARQRSGLRISALAVGDGFAEFDTSNVPTLVAVIGPEHAEARRIYEMTLKELVEAADDCETVEAREKLAMSILSDDQAALLAAHSIYMCSPGALFPLAFSNNIDSHTSPIA